MAQKIRDFKDVDKSSQEQDEQMLALARARRDEAHETEE